MLQNRPLRPKLSSEEDKTMYNFNYHRAGSLDQAKSLIAVNTEAKLLAGGMTLLPTLKLRLAQPSDLIDLNALADLKGIRRDGNNIVIGAMTTHYEVASSDVIKAAIPALAGLAAHIGDPQVRNRGTIGGSVANNDPAADYPAAVLALNATVKTSHGEHQADAFFQGLFETALNDDEIITSISFPIPENAAYMKFPNPASRYALVGVMVAKTAGGVRVAVTGAGGDGVFRSSAMEQALAANFSADALANISVDAADLSSDIHASAEYRAHLISVMAKRAVAAC
jgi:carbon-monoxide dehydrogenase medium subunit